MVWVRLSDARDSWGWTSADLIACHSGGVEGLLDEADSRVMEKVKHALGSPAVLALAKAVESLPAGQQLTILATGVLTNIALWIAVYPHLLSKIDQIVIMGGAEGRGNRSPTAEFNILCDPEAAAMVFGKMPFADSFLRDN